MATYEAAVSRSIETKRTSEGQPLTRDKTKG